MSTERFDSPHPRFSRRRFLVLAGGAAGATALIRPVRALAAVPSSGFGLVQTQATPKAIIAGPAVIDLAGRRARTWAYNGAVPGPLVRVKAGEPVRVKLTNMLEDTTTVHWHGIALPNAMDGVPDVTQPPVAKGSSFDYEFIAPDPGTYFFHPHMGMQLDQGLYAPLIVDDPSEPGGYDEEWIIVLDDWTDGVGRSPDKILARLQRGMGMGSGNTSGGEDMNMDMGSMDHGNMAAGSMMSDALGGMAGDVAYPLYLINGRPPKDPETFTATPGQRVRLRIINAGSDTAFRFAIAGHRLTVTHADGFPVLPIDTDAVLLGMGERIDAIVTCRSGASPVIARAEGKGGSARAVLRGGTGKVRRWEAPELEKQLLTVADLSPTDAAILAPREPDRVHRLELGGNDMTYKWTINGSAYDPAVVYPSSLGERVRLVLQNTSTMWHPMHLHGHTFAVVNGGAPGARKDTVIVTPGQTMTVDFDASNPGKWMLHCHNTYHLEAGMMTTVQVA